MKEILFYIWCVLFVWFVGFMVVDIVQMRRKNFNHWSHIAMTATGVVVVVLGLLFQFMM